MLRAIYNTRFGKFIWRQFKKLSIAASVSVTLKQLMGISYQSIQDMVSQIDLKPDRDAKHALVVTPICGNDAATVYISSLCESLKALGYTIHLLVYNQDSSPIPDRPYWDYKYKISSSNPNFGRWQIAGRDKFNVDSNLIDDWMDENLLSFTKILHWIYKFELCMCQYVFTSKIFSMFDENTLKILSTLDIFSNRNSRLQPVGIAPYYFSCSVEEEKRAFERADKIIAIQREDAKFFKANTDKPVHTIPYLTKKKYLAQKNINGKLSVGYLASTNEPNIHAIERFISCIKGVDTVHLHIAGSISDSIKQRQDNVSVIGSVVDIEKFYTEHDLYINPDEFDSGLKIKTVEALAYGRPIICTAASSSGIDVSAPYHLAKDAAQCADLVRACIDNNTLLQEMHDESMRVYDSFVDKYKEQCTLKELI